MGTNGHVDYRDVPVPGSRTRSSRGDPRRSEKQPPCQWGGSEMPWGVHTEFTDEEGPEVEIDEEQ
jgi:hypothetical protein